MERPAQAGDRPEWVPLATAAALTSPRKEEKPKREKMTRHTSVGSLGSLLLTSGSGASTEGLATGRRPSIASSSEHIDTSSPESPRQSPNSLMISAPQPRTAPVVRSPSTGVEGNVISRFIPWKSKKHQRHPSSNVGDDVWLAMEPAPILWQPPKSGSFVGPAISPIPFVPSETWCVETGRRSAQMKPPFEFVEDQQFVSYYTEFLQPIEHAHYVGKRKDGEPCIASVEHPRSDRKKIKAIVRLPQGDERLFLPSAPVAPTLALLFPDIAFSEAKWLKDKVLTNFERSTRPTREYKFGVLYQRAGQRDEDEIYGNNSGDLHFAGFLEWIGQRVELKGWTKFRGGLNTTHNSTGVFAVYTEFGGNEVMFHVAPYIPCMPGDNQQIERKRHVGNDVVVIVIRDPDCTTPFDPTIFRSHFNHVFCVMQPDKTHSTPHWKIAFTYRIGVAQYGPFFPFGRSFEQTSLLRDFLLTKLIVQPCTLPGFGRSLSPPVEHICRIYFRPDCGCLPPCSVSVEELSQEHDQEAAQPAVCPS